MATNKTKSCSLGNIQISYNIFSERNNNNDYEGEDEALEDNDVNEHDEGIVAGSEEEEDGEDLMEDMERYKFAHSFIHLETTRETTS